jgi:hypothetical protein
MGAWKGAWGWDGGVFGVFVKVASYGRTCICRVSQGRHGLFFEISSYLSSSKLEVGINV